MTDPVLRLFVAEGLSKPENRANVWLIAAMGVGQFWVEFAEQIGLDPDCVVEPRQWPGRRPDLTVFQSGMPVAIIECESFGANKGQIDDYKANCSGLRILQVLGEGEPAADITWSCIKEIALAVKGRVPAQQRVSLELLVAAIEYAAGSAPRSAMRWLNLPDELPDNSWLRDACAPLLDLPSDVVRAHGAAEGSASIRLLKPKRLLRAGRSGLGMAMVQAGRPGKAFLPSPEHLTQHFEESVHGWITDWAAMLHALVPSFIPDGRRLITVPTDTPDGGKAAMVAGCFRKLVSCLRPDDPSNSPSSRRSGRVS